MIYGLKITYSDTWYFCDPATRFAPSYGTVSGAVSEKAVFGLCLEEYLQERECETSLPQASKPWNFYKGESEDQLKADQGELIVSLHQGDKDALWNLYQWASESCTCFRIKSDY